MTDQPAEIPPEIQAQKARKELEDMVIKYAKSESDNLLHKNKVDELDKKLKRAIKDNDQLANRIKILTNDKNQLNDTLSAKVAQLTVLEQKNITINNAQGVKVKEYEDKIHQLEDNIDDLHKQIEAHKIKEGELHDSNERLSMRHMILQAELDETLKKAPDHRTEVDVLNKRNESLRNEVQELGSKLAAVTEVLEGEREQIKHLQSANDGNDSKYRDTIDELQNEIKVMRRKHQIATKELLKQIKQLQSQLEKYTNNNLAAPPSVAAAAAADIRSN